MSSASTTRARARRARRRASARCCAEVAARGAPTGAPMLARTAEVDRRAQGQSAAAAGRRDRRGDPVPGMAAADNYIFLGVRSDTFDRGDTQAGARSNAARHPARPAADVLTGGDADIVPRSTAEASAFLDEPQPLIITKASRRSRVHRRAAHGFGRRQALTTPTASSSANSASSACSPRRPIRARPARIPYLRRKVAAVIERAGFDPASHSGKALVNVLEHYPRDELFQIDEDTLFAFALADPAARRAAARARAGAPRPLRPLRLGARLSCRATATTAQVRAAIGDYLAAAYRRPHVGLLSVLPGRPAGARPFHHRPHEGETPEPDRADAGSRRRGDRAHLGRRLRRPRSRERTSRRARAPLRQRYGQAFRGRLSRRPIAAETRDCRHPRSSNGLSAERPLGVDFYRDATDDAKARVSLKVCSYGEPIPLSRARADAREHGLPGRRRAAPSTSDRPAATAPDFWLHDMVLERADGGADRPRRAQGRARSLLPGGDARRRRERRLQRAGR